MKKEEIEKLTNEQLYQKIKTGKSVLYVTLALLVIYGVYMIYNMIEGTWETGPQITIPFLFLAIMIPNWVNIKNLKEELEKRAK